MQVQKYKKILECQGKKKKTTTYLSAGKEAFRKSEYIPVGIEPLQQGICIHACEFQLKEKSELEEKLTE